MDQNLHLPLLNFIFYLYYEKKTVFCEWVILNQAVIDELNFEGRGLRYITSGAANDVHRELEREFKL